MATAKDLLRAKVLGQQVKRIVVDIEGLPIEVRQMNVGQMLDAVNEEDNKRRMARYLIDCCYVPDTEEKVFDEADIDVLMEMPAGGYYTQIMNKINEQLLPKQLEVAGKS